VGATKVATTKISFTFDAPLGKPEGNLLFRLVSSNEKLDLISCIPESAIEKAARILLNLRESWELTTKEERTMLVRSMIQEIGYDVGTKKNEGNTLKK